MKTLGSAALLTLLFLSPGQTARADAPAAPATPPAGSFAAPLAPLVPGSAAAALEALAGKPQIVGITTKTGAMFLGRVLSGDHTHYAVQAFHFVGRPRTVAQAVGTGRYRRTVRTQEQTTIPDVQAVGYLLQGAAGSRVNPPEAPAGSGTLAAADIKCLQALSPPAKTARRSARKAATTPVAAPVPASPAATPAAVPAVTPASRWAWTMATLWPPPAGTK